MTKQKVFIPFRDRGLDPRRGANLEVVMGWWHGHGFEPVVVDDGLAGDAQFNRHRAYNRAVSGNPDERVFVFTEADMLIHPDQIRKAIGQAKTSPGLVVPFTQYRYLSDRTTTFLRDNYHDMDPQDLAEWWALPAKDPLSVFDLRAESTMEDGKSIGAVNVFSRKSIETVGGFTEATSGNWYDDNIVEEAFAYLTGSPTRWVKGPALHLYHLPGWKGGHLSQADRDATQRNRSLLAIMRRNITMDRREQVKALMEARLP